MRRLYAQQAGVKKEDSPSPKEIYEIAIGMMKGNKDAAIEAYKQMAEVVGDTISNAVTLLDGLVVIGGGLAGASSLFMPFLIDEMNSSFVKPNGSKQKRLIAEIYNLDDDSEMEKFVKSEAKEIQVYGTNKKVKYDPSQKIGVGVSKLSTSKAIAVGAYAFALHKIDSK